MPWPHFSCIASLNTSIILFSRLSNKTSIIITNIVIFEWRNLFSQEKNIFRLFLASPQSGFLFLQELRLTSSAYFLKQQNSEKCWEIFKETFDLCRKNCCWKSFWNFHSIFAAVKIVLTDEKSLAQKQKPNSASKNQKTSSKARNKRHLERANNVRKSIERAKNVFRTLSRSIWRNWNSLTCIWSFVAVGSLCIVAIKKGI